MRNYNRTSKFLLLATLSFFLSLNFLLPTSASLTDTAKTTSNIKAYAWNVQNLQATKFGCDQVKLTCSIKWTWGTPEILGSYLTLYMYQDSKMEGPQYLASTTGVSIKEMTLHNFPSGTYYFKVVHFGLPYTYQHANFSSGSITITI